MLKFLLKEKQLHYTKKTLIKILCQANDFDTIKWIDDEYDIEDLHFLIPVCRVGNGKLFIKILEHYSEPDRFKREHGPVYTSNPLMSILRNVLECYTGYIRGIEKSDTAINYFIKKGVDGRYINRHVRREMKKKIDPFVKEQLCNKLIPDINNIICEYI